MIIIFAYTTGNCKYSEWGQWTNCNKSCDKQIQSRHRTILNQAWYGGIKCEKKKLKEQQSCNPEACTGFTF